jgi:hypothetical protein
MNLYKRNKKNNSKVKPVLKPEQSKEKRKPRKKIKTESEETRPMSLVPALVTSKSALQAIEHIPVTEKTEEDDTSQTPSATPVTLTEQQKQELERLRQKNKQR